MTDAPTLDERVSLPEVAASADITHYSDVYRLLEPYKTANGRRVVVMPGSPERYRILAYSYEMPSYQKLKLLIDNGAKEYPEFENYWHQVIEPDEAKQIAVWRDQANQWRPFDGLQSLARLQFPSSRIDIGAIALHGSGSGNTDPEGIYTTLAVKNLAWAVGHEGTHLLVDRYAGLNWTGRPGAKRAIQLASEQNSSGDDIEEALCLLMQVKLSQYYGQTPTDFRISPKLHSSVKRTILARLEDDWPNYQADAHENLMDWLIKCALAALSQEREIR